MSKLFQISKWIHFVISIFAVIEETTLGQLSLVKSPDFLDNHHRLLFLQFPKNFLKSVFSLNLKMKVVLAISILFSVFAINSGHIVLPGFSIGIGSGGIGIGHGNGYGYGNGYGNGYGSGYGNGYGYGSGYGNGYGYRPWGSFRRRRALQKNMK